MISIKNNKTISILLVGLASLFLSYFALTTFSTKTVKNDLYADFSDYKKKPTSEKPPKLIYSEAEKAVSENKLKRYLKNEKEQLKDSTNVNKTRLGTSSYANNKVKGTWLHQEFMYSSSQNKGFSTVNSAYDKKKDLLYVVTRNGHIWKVNKNETNAAGTSWTMINNRYNMHKGSFHVLNKSNGASTSIRSYNKKMQYSNDEGRTWYNGKGINFQETYDNSGVQDLANGQRFLGIVKTNNRYEAVTTTDGVNYTSLGIVSSRSRVLEIPNSKNLFIISYESNKIKTYRFAPYENSLKLLKTANIRVPVEGAYKSFGTWANGALHLYYATLNEIYYSGNGGASWTKKASGSYTDEEIHIPRTVSANYPQTIFKGYLDFGISSNYGASFEDTSHTLGWDLEHMKTYTKKDGSIFQLVGTHFGLFMSYTPAFVNSYINLNNGSSHGLMYDADASKFGYSNAALQDRGAIEFSQNERTNLKDIMPTDGLRVVYANSDKSSWAWLYFGKMYHKSNSGYSQGVRHESKTFIDKWKGNVLVESPNQNEDAVYVGGFNKLKKFRYDGSKIIETDHHYNFGGVITGFGYSAVDNRRWYVSTKNGDFFYSSDSGNTFKRSTDNTTKPRGNDNDFSHTKIQHTIKTSATDPLKVYYVGAGNTMLISNDGGKSFTEHKSGLNVYRFRDIAVTPNDEYVFGACGTGGIWIYSKSANRWYEAFDSPVPHTDFTAVNYISDKRIVQFSTFGYGMLQFKLDQSTITEVVDNPLTNLIRVNGTHTIKSKNYNENVISPAWDDYNASLYSSAEIFPGHKWEFTHIGNNVHTIKNAQTGRYLNVSGNICDNGTNVVTWTTNNTNNSKWYIKYVDGNHYLLPAHCPSQSLSRMNSGSNIITWSHDKSYNNQKFDIIPYQEDSVTNCSYQVLDGLALDIGSGGGKTYVIGIYGDVYLRNNNRWNKLPFGGFDAVKIDVTGAGVPWIIASDNRIYYYDNNKWINVNGGGVEIGCNGNNVFVIGTNQRIYKRVNNNWSVVSTARAKRLDVASNGNLWIVSLDDRVYEYSNNKWTVRGNITANDISVAEGGSEVWALRKSNGVVCSYNGNNAWDDNAGIARDITVASDKSVWVVNSNNNIFKANCYGTQGSRLSGKISELAASAELDNTTSLTWDYHLPIGFVSVISYTLQHFDYTTGEYTDLYTENTSTMDDPNTIHIDYKHDDPIIGENFYQVKIEFANGDIEFSDTQFVEFYERSLPVTIAPNPASHTLGIDLSNYQDREINYQIINMQGQVMSKGHFDSNHSNVESIDLQEYNNGNYIIYVKPQYIEGTSIKFMVVRN